MENLEREVKEIADYLHNKADFQQDYATDNDIKDQDEIDAIGAVEWLEQELEIRYIVDREGQFISAQVAVAFGGPTIWVNFDEGEVRGYWGNDTATANFIDKMDVEDALRNRWESR